MDDTGEVTGDGGRLYVGSHIGNKKRDGVDGRSDGKAMFATEFLVASESREVCEVR